MYKVSILGHFPFILFEINNNYYSIYLEIALLLLGSCGNCEICSKARFKGF